MMALLAEAGQAEGQGSWTVTLSMATGQDIQLGK